MDEGLAAAAQALARFEPLAALKRVALREDPSALALRGIALAQLGDYAAARRLLGRAARGLERGLGRADPRMRAGCLAALGEVALARRDLREAARWLDAALRALEAQDDRWNAAFVRLQRVRQLVWPARSKTRPRCTDRWRSPERRRGCARSRS